MASNWLTLEDTAAYLGMGKTVLYSLARDGRIPATKLGKKWAFDRTDLDNWVRGTRPKGEYFLSVDYKIEENDSLREPQKEGSERILSELRSGVLDCIVQVQMLGEGFDHQKLSVAAIFRPFRSLASYIQFVGRRISKI